MKQKSKLFLMECRVAGCQYHDASEVWDKLSIGTELYLERDIENRYDPEAVAIIFHDCEKQEEYILGYVPRGENKLLAIFLEMGHNDIFECRLSKKDSEVHAEQQLQVTIKIKRKLSL